MSRKQKLLLTALVAAGASGLNQWVERDVDALMHRTRLRPLPDGRLQQMEAGCFAVVTVTVVVSVRAVLASVTSMVAASASAHAAAREVAA